MKYSSTLFGCNKHLLVISIVTKCSEKCLTPSIFIDSSPDNPDDIGSDRNDTLRVEILSRQATHLAANPFKIAIHCPALMSK